MEGLNNKLKPAVRKWYSFRIFRAGESFLYYTLGGLLEPEFIK